MNTLPPRRLSEQDVAQLYLHTEAALSLDRLLQSDAPTPEALVEVHDSIRSQTPDLALISLSLCGVLMVRDWPVDADDDTRPVLQELVTNAEDNLLTVGRLWLDSACHGIAPDPAEDKPILISIPDRLRILTSLFQELRDVLPDHAVMRQAMNTLYYQAESHADLADQFVQALTKPARKSKAAKDIPPKKLQQIPLPLDLQQKTDTGKVVAFSLFAKGNKKPGET